MSQDPKRVYGGFSILDGGMNGGISASLLPDNQVAAAANVTFRDGYARTRAPWCNLLLSFDSAQTQTNWTGKFQGAIYYQSDLGQDGFIISRGGRLFKLVLGQTNVISEITVLLPITVTAQFTVPALHGTVLVSVNNDDIFTLGQSLLIDSGSYTVSALFTNQFTLTYNGAAAHGTVATGTGVLDGSGNQLVKYVTNPSTYDFIDLFQADSYVIILGGQNKTVIFDGANARTAGTNEIPTGWLGIYLWGRIWIVLPDRKSFVGSDLTGSQSGTATAQYRDAILKFTENNFLNGGGAFIIPNNGGQITALGALATQDTSLGVGPLLVGTPNLVTSCNAPVDRTTWQNLTFPIQTVSLIDYGPLGPRNTVSVNGDLWYRSVDGIRSFRVARQDMDMWGNTPMSREISPLLDGDTKDLLFFGSAMLFDNKLFTTVSPSRTALGVVHQGLAVINFDLISSMRTKLQPAWEGVYTGLQIFQVLKAQVAGVERGFAFAFNPNTNDVELWELQTTGSYDQFSSVSAGVTSIARSAVQAFIETGAENHGDSTQLKELYTAELYLENVVDTVTFNIRYRPDQYPNWLDWVVGLQLCANVTQCVLPANCQLFQTDSKLYAARIMLPRPPESACNPVSQRPFSQAYEFQYRLEFTGHCQIRGFRAHAILRPDRMDGACPASPVCNTVPSCGTSWFTYNIR